MAGYFMIGEEKVRAGSYFHVGKNGDETDSGTINGIVTCWFRSDFGPLGEVQVLNKDDGYKDIYGTTGVGVDALKYAFQGGAQTIIACRIGTGGTQGKITLQDTEAADAIDISTMYPSSKAFSVTIREKLTDSTIKQCIIYSGTTVIKTIEFTAGAGEVKNLADKLTNDKQFSATIKEGKEDAVLENCSQSAFTPGEDPKTSVSDYSDAAELTEAYETNTVCADTEDKDVLMLMVAYLNRTYESGNLSIGLFAENPEKDIDARIETAASLNDEKVVYILNSKFNLYSEEISGFRTAALLAGMVAAVSSKESLTHTVINGATDLDETLANTKIIEALQKGCVVLSLNSARQIWIDKAITTLVTPDSEQDSGWKKIRRVKTRFELMRRCNKLMDSLIGKVDNDTNGRQTIISQLNGVGKDMVAEGKIVSFKASISDQYVADGDSCWFVFDVVDKDSAEHIYTFYNFQFSTNA
jgi:hypothetical protein